MTTAPTIRLARPDDREAIWRLLNDLVITFPPERAAFDPTLDEILARPDMLVLVADAPDLGVVGYLVASCRASLIANGLEVWVAELIADARVRRTGVGRALMARAEDWAREQGAAQVTLATSRAHDFYRALDYDGFATYFRKRL
ncbi:MAG TPA: GNAT family N-acetyltransferase [Cellulomonadaceae bacterium]|nr:GNAT family N-acetyltransferase [Cellulomonadaceae bacterium]